MLDKTIAFVESLIVHALFLAIIFFGMDLPKKLWFIDEWFIDDKIDVVENTLLDENAVLLELERLKREADFNNVTQQAQHNVLQQQKIEHKQFISHEQGYLKTLRKQRKTEKQQLKILKRQRQKEEKTLRKLLRKKEKLEKALE